MIATSPPARAAMTLAAGVVSLAVLAIPSPSVADVGHDVDIKAPNTDSGRPLTWWEAISSGLAGHHIELLYPADSADLDAMPVVRRTSTSTESSSTPDRSPEYAQIALGGLGGMMIAAIVAGTLRGRRRRQPALEAALAAGGADEMSRAAGLLGDRLVQHSRTDAAAYVYRAAVDLDHEYWSPIAQVALANLLTAYGDRKEAQALMEAVVASGHPRAVPLAQAGLLQLMTGRSDGNVADLLPDQHRWEGIGDGNEAGVKSSVETHGVYRRGSTRLEWGNGSTPDAWGALESQQGPGHS